MMIYEVRVTLDADIQEAWLDWIGPHVEAVLATGCFTGAQLERLIDPVGDLPVFHVRYYFERIASLRRYEAEFAGPLRADGLQRFGNSMTATRTVQEILHSQEASLGS